MKIKTLIISILLLGTALTANAGWFDFLFNEPTGGGMGTLEMLNSWRATSTPVSGIAPNVSGKTIYAPYSDSFFANLLVGGTATTTTLCFDDNTCMTTATGGSGSGTVTSVDMSVPTGMTIAGNPITTAGTLALTYTAGYEGLVTTDKDNWNTAYGWGDHSGLYDILGQATSTLSSHTTTYNHDNYDTAYSWGDWSGEGFIALTDLSGTSPITYNNGTGAIGINTADTSTTGALTSTDWNTFNNKQATITDGTNLTFTGATLNVDDPFSVTNLTATNASTTQLSAVDYFGIKDEMVDVDTLAGATYTTVEDWWNITQSAGKVNSGGQLSDNGDGTITVSEGYGLLKTNNSSTGDNFSADMPANNSLGISQDEINYIYADYNGGSPIFATTTSRDSINGRSEVAVGIAYNDGTHIHTLSGGVQVQDLAQRTHKRAEDLYGFLRASGMVISETGTRGLAMTEGKFWRGNTELSATASPSITFSTWYNDGAWQETTGQTTVSNTQYNDYGTGLETIAPNKYGVYYIYRDFDEHFHLVYGVGSYNLATAQGLGSPDNLPDVVKAFSMLLAKVIVERDGTNFTGIQTPWEIQFSGQTVTDHGSLGGLTDDDHTQYLLADGTRALTGNWATGDFDITGANLIESDNATSTFLTSTTSWLGTILSGIWNGTAIDFSDYTNATAGTGITFTDDAISTNDSEIVLSSLSGYDANGVIDWTSDQGATNINAGNYTDTNTTYVSSDFTHNDLTGYEENRHLDWTSDLGAVNIHSGNYTDTNTTYTGGTGITLTGTVFSTTDNEIVHDNLSGFVANEHLDWTIDLGATNINTANYVDNNTTYVSSDWTLSDITGYVADEHLNWTNDLGAVNINAGNYTDTDTTYLGGTGLTLTGTTFSVDTSQNISTLSNLTTNGFVKTSGGTGALSIDTSTYLTGNETITLSGDISGSGATSITTTIGADKILESMLKSVNAPTDEYVLTYESTTGDFEWQVGGAGGSLFTDDGLFTYLTSTTDDLVLGSDATATASLWLDVSEDELYLGSGGAGDSDLVFGASPFAWTIGFDDTDDSFAIASSTALGTSNALTISKSTLGTTLGGNLALGANDITMSGSLGITGTRLTKGWFTDLEVTNAIAGSITGNSATVSTITGLAPDTATTQATQGNITSLGTLTALQVDNLNLNTNTISSTAGTDLLITPLAGQQLILDGLMVIDNGVLTGATSITSTAFVGDITGALTGNADTVTGFTPASGSLTLAGADALTITTTGETNSTFPLGTKTLVATDVATLSSLTSIGTIGTGVWNGTAIDIGTYTNLTAGRSLTLTGDDVLADSELYTGKHKIAFETPTATDDFFFGEVAKAQTFKSIYCKTLVGTVDLDISIAGSDINGTDITCNTTGVLDSSLGGDTTGAVGEELKLLITSVASAPTYLMVQLNYEYTD